MDTTSGHLGSGREGEGGREGWDGIDLRPGWRAEALLHREGWGLRRGRLGTLQKERKKTVFVTDQ